MSAMCPANSGKLHRFGWGDKDYERAFAALLKCSGERTHVHAYLQEVLHGYPRDSHAVDWGAGSGDLTAWLLAHFDHVTAVEPSPVFRACLARQCPDALIVDGTLSGYIPRCPVDVAIISHVFYHLPDHQWAACALRAARQLSERGVLLMMLKDPNSGCNRMLEHFGAPRFNLVEQLQPLISGHGEFNYTLDRVPGSFVTTHFEETLDIARLLLCDRDDGAFSAMPDEAEFVDYVREHFWDEETGQGGWHYDVMIASMRRRRA
jgi:hypothetical protein